VSGMDQGDEHQRTIAEVSKYLRWRESEIPPRYSPISALLNPINLSGKKIMNEEETKAEISICEKKLANIREIQVSNEVRYKEIKEKGMRLENKLPRLFAKAALGEISSSQAEQAKQKLNKLKGQLKQIAILLKGLKLEEPQYVERISQAKRILDLDKGKNGI
jgi:hypothetical protein